MADDVVPNIELAELQARARAGDIQAQYELGVALRDGIGAEIDFAAAALWFTAAAQAGHSEAQASLGVLHWAGAGVEKNNRAAMKYLEMANVQGNRIAGLLMAEYLLDSNAPDVYDAKRGFSIALELAVQGEVLAYGRVAQCYLQGEGVEQNQKEAFRWFRLAAENDELSGHGQYWLGYCYLKGIGVEVDLALAEEWFKRAADAGYPSAQYSLDKLKARVK